MSRLFILILPGISFFFFFSHFTGLQFFFLSCIRIVQISDLMVSVIMDLWYLVCHFHFSVLSERLHATVYSSIDFSPLEPLDKQRRETIGVFCLFVFI